MHRQIAGKLTGPVTKWIVLAAWLVAFVGLGAFSSKLADVQNNEAASWLPASAESTRALEKLEPFQDPNSIPTVVVYEKASGLTQEDLAAAQAQVAEFQAMDGVEGEVVGPIPSKDGEVAQTIVTFNFGTNGWEDMPDTADQLREISAIDGVNVYIAGSGGQAADSFEAFSGIDSTLLLAALGVVIVILLFTYRSPVLWILPIFSVVVVLATSLGLVYFLAKYADLTVNGQSQAILSILVIGAGTDYALLLVARYREELRRHEDRHEAMAFALHRAAPAILASAATVAVGMLCLMFAEMSSTAGLGPVTAIGVGVTFLVMVTLLPALLVIFGRWIFWPMRPTYRSAEPTQSGIWAKVGRLISIRPRAVWAITGSAAPGRLPGPAQARRQRPGHRRAVHEGLRVGRRPAGAHRPRPRGHLQPDHGRGQRRPGRGGRPGAGRGGRARAALRARGPGRRRVHHRRHPGRPRLPDRPSTWSRTRAPR